MGLRKVWSVSWVPEVPKGSQAEADLTVKYHGCGQRNAKLVRSLDKMTSKFPFNFYYYA